MDTEIRILFSYQIILKYLLNFFLILIQIIFLEFISKKNKWKINYRYTKNKKISFENYLNIFCEICKINKINLIILPIIYNKKFNKDYQFVKKIDQIELDKYVSFNNKIIQKL